VDIDDNTSPNWGVKSGPIGSSAGSGSDVGSDAEGSKVDVVGDDVLVASAAGCVTWARETASAGGGIERGSLRPDENICVRISPTGMRWSRSSTPATRPR
jgi:hypothetical protein